MADIISIGSDYTTFILYLLGALAILIVLRTILRAKLIFTLIIMMITVSIAGISSLIILENYQDTDIMTNALYFMGINFVLFAFLGMLANKNFVKPIKSLEIRTRKMAEGDLVTYSDQKIKGIGETGSLAYSTNELNRRFRSMIDNIKSSAMELSSAAELLAAGSEEVSATTNEVTATIQNIAEGASEQVRKLDEVSNILTNMVSVIDDSIREIAVTSKITLDLSEQTNLVALNASIEAAKAGEHGEGFTVVADHVRQLSIESKSAASSVNQIIRDISDRINESVSSIVTAVEKVASVAENTAASSQEAAAAAEEQSASLQEITEQAQKLTSLSIRTERDISEFIIN